MSDASSRTSSRSRKKSAKVIENLESEELLSLPAPPSKKKTQKVPSAPPEPKKATPKETKSEQKGRKRPASKSPILISSLLFKDRNKRKTETPPTKKSKKSSIPDEKPISLTPRSSVTSPTESQTSSSNQESSSSNSHAPLPKLKLSLTGTPTCSTVPSSTVSQPLTSSKTAEDSNTESDEEVIHFDEDIAGTAPDLMIDENRKGTFSDNDGSEDMNNDSNVGSVNNDSNNSSVNNDDSNNDSNNDDSMSDMGDDSNEEMSEEPEDDVSIEEEKIIPEPVKPAEISTKRQRKLPSKLQADFINADLAVKISCSKNHAARFFHDRKKEIEAQTKKVGQLKTGKKRRNRVPTGYTIWCNSYRPKLQKQFPSYDFARLNKKLGEIWTSYPIKEKNTWKRKAARMAKHGQTQTQQLSKHLSHKIKETVSEITPVPKSTKAKTVKSAVNKTESTVSEPQRSAPAHVKPPVLQPEITKMDVEPIDIAAQLILMGEGLTSMANDLRNKRENRSMDSLLDILLDAMVCSMSSLMCLTAQVPELDRDFDINIHKTTIANTNYYLPVP